MKERLKSNRTNTNPNIYPKLPELIDLESQFKDRIESIQPIVVTDQQGLQEKLIKELSDRASQDPLEYEGYAEAASQVFRQIELVLDDNGINDTLPLPLRSGIDFMDVPSGIPTQLAAELYRDSVNSRISFEGSTPTRVLKLMDGVYEVTGAVPIASSFDNDQNRSLPPHTTSEVDVLTGSEDPMRYAARLLKGTWGDMTVFFYEELIQMPTHGSEKPKADLRWSVMNREKAIERLEDITMHFWSSSNATLKEISSLPEPPNRRQKTRQFISKLTERLAYPRGRTDIGEKYGLDPEVLNLLNPRRNP